MEYVRKQQADVVFYSACVPEGGSCCRQEPINRKVALASIVVEAEHAGTRRDLRQLLRNRCQRRARGNADQDAFFTRRAPRHLACGFGLDLDHAIEQGGVQVLRNEARTNALDRMRRRRATRDHR